MRLHIGQEAIKATFIQTRPGAEFIVAQQLAAACNSADIQRYAFLKALGSYDIVLLYPSHFGFHLTRFGLISGILKSNTLLCYPYLWNESSDQPLDVITALNQTTLAGFSLLKFNHEGAAKVREAEEILFSLLKRKFPLNSYTLGSLGWNELILIHTQNDLSNTVQNFFTLSFDPSLQLLEPYSMTKTFSFIAINYKELLGPDWQSLPLHRMTPEEIRELFQKAKLTEKISEPLTQHLEPTLGISAPLGPHYHKVRKYWLDLGFTCEDVLGEEDLVVTPTAKYRENKGTWGDFIEDVLYFRFKFRHLIQSTTTTLSLGPTENRVNLKTIDAGDIPPPPVDSEIFSKEDYPYEDLETYFGEKGAPLLAVQIYALNRLSCNPIIGSVFRGMRDYPRLIMNRGSKRFKKYKIPNEVMAFKFTENLGHGLELRSYGTYGDVERPYGRYAKLKGGVQRALLAMEYLPTKILDRASPYPWLGFINAYEEPKFFELQEVIYVPLESLWQPEMWWALYHEVAHIIIDRHPSLADRYEVDLIQSFLATRKDAGAWLTLFTELAAEVIGYELGYFGDFDLFLATLWPYLKRIEATLKDYASLEAYLIRTFFVELWEKYCNAAEERNLADELLRAYLDDAYLFQSLFEHAQKLEKILSVDEEIIIPDKDFIISNHITYFKEIIPFVKYLHDQISHIEEEYSVTIFHQKAWVDDPSSKKIADDLLQGKMYWEKIEHPEAVYYHILKDNYKLGSDAENFSFSIATILTFWISQVQWLQKAPYALLRPV